MTPKTMELLEKHVKEIDGQVGDLYAFNCKLVACHSL